MFCPCNCSHEKKRSQMLLSSAETGSQLQRRTVLCTGIDTLLKYFISAAAYLSTFLVNAINTIDNVLNNCNQ